MPLETVGTIAIPDPGSLRADDAARAKASQPGATATAEPVNLASSRRAFESNDLRLTYRSWIRWRRRLSRVLKRQDSRVHPWPPPTDPDPDNQEALRIL